MISMPWDCFQQNGLVKLEPRILVKGDKKPKDLKNLKKDFSVFCYLPIEATQVMNKWF